MRSYLTAIGMLCLITAGPYAAKFVFRFAPSVRPTPFTIAPADVQAALAPSPSVLAENENGRVWLVPFATSRELPEGDPSKQEWAGRFTAMQLGVCQVEIPYVRSHGIAATVSPEASEDALALSGRISRRATQILSGDEYFAFVRQQVAASAGRDVLVFIHGYNVSFHDAVCRAAQLAEDLPFNGVTVCYSWPSQAELSGYQGDGRRAQWGQMALVAFLGRLRESLDHDVRIHVLAHSMGNRVLLSALSALSQRPISATISSASGVVDDRIICNQCCAWANVSEEDPPLENVIFAAPDVEAESFQRTVRNVRRTMRHATLYASALDFALAGSQKVNLGEKRAGDANHLVVMDNLTTIDVTPIPHHDPLGHSYYGNSPQVRRDIFFRLKFNQPPQNCGWLEARTYRGQPYFTLTGDPPSLLSLQAAPTTLR